jgi:hypothetical protein
MSPQRDVSNVVVYRLSKERRYVKKCGPGGGSIKGRIMPRTTRKAKKSFTLSSESVAFLEGLRKKHRARSVSSVLEDLVKEARRQEKLKAYEDQVTEYYDSLTEEEREEERAWAAIGDQELAALDLGEPLE